MSVSKIRYAGKTINNQHLFTSEDEKYNFVVTALKGGMVYITVPRLEDAFSYFFWEFFIDCFNKESGFSDALKRIFNTSNELMAIMCSFDGVNWLLCTANDMQISRMFEKFLIENEVSKLSFQNSRAYASARKNLSKALKTHEEFKRAVIHNNGKHDFLFSNEEARKRWEEFEYVTFNNSAYRDVIAFVKICAERAQLELYCRPAICTPEEIFREYFSACEFCQTDLLEEVMEVFTRYWKCGEAFKKCIGVGRIKYLNIIKDLQNENDD